MRPSLAAALATAALLSPATGGAQSLGSRLVDRFHPAASVVTAVADHRVDASLGFERTAGPLFGVQLEAIPLEGTLIALRAVGGTLSARSPAADERDMGEIAAIGRMRLLRWLDARGAITTRTFSSPLARQRWTSVSLGPDLRMTMLDGRIEGTAGAQLLPIVHISRHSSPDLGVAASMGIRHVSHRYILALAYQLERFDFASVAGERRIEEHSMLVLRAGYRFGKASTPTPD